MAPEIDIAWAAGLFEGEGSCGFRMRRHELRPFVKLGMTDRDVVERFVSIVGVGNVTTTHRPPDKRMWHWSIGGKDDCCRVLGLLWPYLGERRKERALEVLERTSMLRGKTDWLSYCRRGHELSSRNVYINPATGRPKCRICGNMRQRAYRDRRRVLRPVAG
jgi:hypothetical protein